jgi:addiction module HigA family antidote
MTPIEVNVERRQAAPHPGPIIKRDYLDVLGMSVEALAAALDMDLERLAAMLEGRASIDVDAAIRFGRGLQLPAERIMQMQLRAPGEPVSVSGSRLFARPTRTHGRRRVRQFVLFPRGRSSYRGRRLRRPARPLARRRPSRLRGSGPGLMDGTHSAKPRWSNFATLRTTERMASLVFGRSPGRSCDRARPRRVFRADAKRLGLRPASRSKRSFLAGRACRDFRRRVRRPPRPARPRHPQ